MTSNQFVKHAVSTLGLLVSLLGCATDAVAPRQLPACSSSNTAGAPADPFCAPVKPGSTDAAGITTLPDSSIPRSDTDGGRDADGGISSMPVVGGALPCVVAATVKTSCGTCHGATPIGGAPMSLLSLADFQREYTVKTTTELLGSTMKMHQLVKIRLNREMNTKPMPQGSPLDPMKLADMNTWLVGGALAGAVCEVPKNLGDGSECAADPSLFEKLIAKDGEVCYDFRTHGVSSPTDTSKFTVPVNESYNQFYFNVPWPAGSVQTRAGADFDNLKVLHHWLGFTSTSANPHGTVSLNVTGTTLGESSELWGGWAVGGCAVVSPPDVGVRLPDTGKIMIQWHHFNTTGTPQPDGSAVQVCVVPKSQRKFTAGMTFLGTESFNGPFGMPAGMKSDFGGTCTNDSAGPITIFGFSPHMHLLGINMKSVVVRASGGTPEVVFDKPFQFDRQVNYMVDPPIVLQPGDKITSTCTFNNTTPAPVAFGQSTKQEMCYQFALSYPYNELNNGVISLIGATNTCW